LTEEQVKALAEGMRKRWPPQSRPAGQPAPPSLQTKPAGPGNIDAGARVFRRACADCHGADGKGGQRTVGAINDPEKAFLALISDQALRRIAITGRPDLDMPDYAGTKGRDSDFRPLTGEDIDNLLALLVSWRQPGANKRE